MRTQPVPWLVMCSIRPLRAASSCVHRADVLLGHVHRQALDGLVALSVDLALDHVGLTDRQLEALRRMISTSTASCSSPRPCTLLRVRALGLGHAQ